MNPMLTVAFGLAVFAPVTRIIGSGAGCTLNHGTRGRPYRIDYAGPSAKPGFATAPSPPPTSLLSTVAVLPLPGRPVRFDYQTQDTLSGYLYLSHMNDAHIVVFDTRARRVVRTIAGMPGVTGVWVVPELRKLYASVTGQHAVVVIDLDSLTVRARVGPIGFPDGISYVPSVQRIFVSDESGGGELVIDALTNRVVARIPIGGEAGNTLYDPGSGCILVAAQTLDQVVAIDPATATVAGRYAIEGSGHPHGMAVDPDAHILFVANEERATVQVIDLVALRVTATADVGEDPDVLAFDPGLSRLYVATERGGLWVLGVSGKGLESRGRLELPHAHTVSVDARTHLVYVPLQDMGGEPTLRILEGSP